MDRGVAQPGSASALGAEGRWFESSLPDHFIKEWIIVSMPDVRIYKPTKTAMQSGTKKYDKWIIEFITDKPGINPLMGWESSTDTYSEVKLEFTSKELALDYAKKNKIEFEIIEPKLRKINKKSYADNFTK